MLPVDRRESLACSQAADRVPGRKPKFARFDFLSKSLAYIQCTERLATTSSTVDSVQSELSKCVVELHVEELSDR